MVKQFTPFVLRIIEMLPFRIWLLNKVQGRKNALIWLEDEIIRRCMFFVWFFAKLLIRFRVHFITGVTELNRNRSLVYCWAMESRDSASEIFVTQLSCRLQENNISYDFTEKSILKKFARRQALALVLLAESNQMNAPHWNHSNVGASKFK